MDTVPEATSGEQRQVRVRFTTRLPPSFRVPETPFALPSSLTRYGLSEVINTLLATDKPQPFDFLVDGDLLRTSLEKTLLDKNISVETVVNIEYIQALVPPKTTLSFPHPDWISSVNGSLSGIVLTGSYDGFARVLVDGTDCRCTLSGHTEVITSIASLHIEDQKDTEHADVVTASKDRSLRLWTIPVSKNGLKKETTVGAKKIFRGHKSAVQTVAATTSGEICSGSWDGKICLWSTTSQDLSGDEGEGEGERGKKGGNKKRRLAGNETVASGIIEVSPRATLEGHSQCVSSVVWSKENVILSGSWDHSIRSWDSTTGTNTLTLTGTKPILSISVGEGGGGGGGGLVAAGGGDSVLRLWDTRASSGVTPVKQLTSHKGWISSVKWHSESVHHLVSSSYDGTLKLWDIRSVIPLYTMDTKAEKVLCVDWWGTGTAISGGTDSKLSIHSGINFS